jgi:hypothetical protein
MYGKAGEQVKSKAPMLLVPGFPDIGFAAGCCCQPNVLRSSALKV